MRNLIAVLFLIAICTTPVTARTYNGRGSKPDTSFVVYIPNKLDLKKRHPWILGFSPTGNGQDVVGAMSQACDDNDWILVASNNSRNGIPFDAIEPSVLDTINTATRTLAVDPSRMYAGGLSGGAQVSHWLMAKHPQYLHGAIINCGKIEPSLKQQLGYPSGKDVFFLTNPQDFRYKEIAADCQFISSRGCATRWLEFPGGHNWASPGYFSTAMRWLDQQAKRRQALIAVSAKPKSPPTEKLKEQLAAEESSVSPDQNKIANLQENIAEAHSKIGKLADAETMYLKAMATKKRTKEDSPDNANLMIKLADVYSLEGKNVEAADLLQQALAIQEKGTDKIATATTMQAYAKALYKCGKTTEADSIYARLKDFTKN
jgi:hypothetical protein